MATRRRKTKVEDKEPEEPLPEENAPEPEGNEEGAYLGPYSQTYGKERE